MYRYSLETWRGDTPSQIFETVSLPALLFPCQLATDSIRQSLVDVGETYHEHRRQIMLARQEGLTTTYNRFHNPDERAADIARLRQLHVEMDRAVAAARAVSLPADREILHTIPQEFTVDGQAGIKEPAGMSGVRLEAEAHIITGTITAAQNIIKAINKAGFEVEDIVLGSLASSIAVLSEDEKNSGVLLLDIGGGTTDFVAFHRGCIRQSSVIAVGGDHVTNDLTVALRVPIPLADEIKQAYGSAMEERVDPEEEIEIPPSAGRGAARHRR